MTKWYMLTLVGKDRSGIVAKVTAALYDGGCNLGEASMMRLGGNFTIMLMVQTTHKVKELTDMLEPVVDSLGLSLHVDQIEGRLHDHPIPNVRITVFGADRAGIVAHVTGVLAETGFNILDLTSDVAGSIEKPIYVMQIEGTSHEGIDTLRKALAFIKQEDGIEVRVEELETLIG
ncbi:MAG: ACT domain-containing protein [Pseudomonadota bacterium]